MQLIKTSLALLSTVTLAVAGPPATPLIDTSGESTTSTDFSAAEVPDGWAAAKGAWTIDDGALRGAELAADQHAAVITLKQAHVDSAVSFRFQLDGASGFMLSYNHPKGHLFRVNISEKEVRIQTDKDKKDPTSKAEEIATVETELKSGKWYTALCETQGEKVRVQIDNGVALEATHPALAEPKTGYRFVLKGEALRIDDVQTWVTQ